VGCGECICAGDVVFLNASHDVKTKIVWLVDRIDNSDCNRRSMITIGAMIDVEKLFSAYKREKIFR